MICKYFHIHSNVFLLLLSSLPQNQAEYLLFRKWPITALLGSPAFRRDLAFIFRTAPNGVNTVSISQYQKYHINLCLSLQILHKHFFQFLLGPF